MSRRANYRVHGCSGDAVTLHTACVIARRFRDYVPTATQLVEAFGMSRAQAYRWRNAIADANGVEVAHRGNGKFGGEPKPVPIPDRAA